ncbi:MAG TPA: T9SS type A sorting domain-containing protein, partial [Catalimonadaceae bacterium]|nr:T9SS type A sorting domain-containing protein [Catalimonadaceae bacterium]
GDAYSGRNHLNFDISGNIVVAGAIVGDTLSFGGVPFEFDTTYSQRAFVIKISPNGSLLWGRSEIAGSPDRYPAARSLRERNGVVEAYFTGADNNPANHKMIRTTSAGVALPSVMQASTNTFAGVNGLSAHETLSNGRLLYGSLTFQTSPIRSTIIELNSDLTTYKETTADLNNSSTLFPSSFHSLADSQQVVILSTNALVTGTNQLIWGNDTLNFTANASSSPERSVFVRLSNLDCMKNVGYLNYVTVGQNVTTPNKNLVLIRETNVEESTADLNLTIKLLDLNGAEHASLALGNLGRSGGVKDGFMFTNRHFLSWQNGVVAGCYGSWLFKASLPDPVVADQSFAGCLSNRNILSPNEKTLSGNSQLIVFEKNPGLWDVQSSDGNNADLEVVSLVGQHLQNIKMKNAYASFSTKGLPPGMYLLRMASSMGFPKTLRFMVK